MHKYEVGQPYNPGHTSWPEQPELRITAHGIELLLFYKTPTAKEIRDVRSAPATFAWVPGDRVALLCYRFGPGQWSDAPFEAHRQNDGDRGWLGTFDPASHRLVTVMLVDAATGVIKAIRVVTWTPEFAAAVRDSLVHQLAASYDETAAGRELASVYTQNTSNQLATQEAVATCTT